ncbi:site-specific integrase [Thiomicrospira sp. WB1]|uniref:tyrosine-type recombinase/integrase n=1 Tax=Thiomicrospira sp. WB1 TaxID=1685380 RepID=UPI000747089D|nr:site-specific integrase [Thiomicrospira sp. WB1]KUJ71670.1 hypothetical protein AVO41_09155 [Thiomicrospira sp. WB1]
MALHQLTVKQLESAEYNPNGSNEYHDGGGLFVRILAKNKCFYFRYKKPATGKKTNIKMGLFGDLTLKQARDKASNFRQLVNDGHDPKETKTTDENQTFGEIAKQFFQINKSYWSDSHYRTTVTRYKNYLEQPLGKKQVEKIKTRELTDILNKVAIAGSYATAAKLSHIIRGVFKHSYQLGVINVPPPELMTLVENKSEPKNHAYLDLSTSQGEKQFKQFVQDVNSVKAGISVAAALNLALHLFLRTGNLISLKLKHFDREKRELQIPKEEMKSGHCDYKIPLSDQAFEIIDQHIELTKPQEFIFESKRSKCGHISERSLNKTKLRLGWNQNDITIHGLRHTATTFLTEKGFPSELTELQLHHRLPGIRGIYNKAHRIEERRQMMQYWSDYIDSLLNNMGQAA